MPERIHINKTITVPPDKHHMEVVADELLEVLDSLGYAVDWEHYPKRGEVLVLVQYGPELEGEDEND